MSELQFYTIGVFGSSPESFFGKLSNAEIDMFIDIRQRRAVRGSQYAFVNSKRLQSKLAEMDIAYRHILELAPTKEIRNAQKEADMKSGVAKRSRETLSPLFSNLYTQDVLEHFDLPKLLSDLNERGGKRVVLFCVESTPAACHRSIVASAISKLTGTQIIHL